MKSDGVAIIAQSTQSTKESSIQNLEKNNSSNSNEESFKVYIRIKPHIHKLIPIPKNSFVKQINSSKNIIDKNNCQEKNIIKVDKNILYLEEIKTTKNKNVIKSYIYDNIFNETATNDTVFNGAIKSMIDKILLGYNSTVLAYGVTGTGKTYTIFGDLNNNFKDEGIIFKACDYLFEKIELNKSKDINTNNLNISYEIKISYVEIYNEIVKDLINENTPSLMIVEDPIKGVICSNIREIIINDSIQLKKIIDESNKRRTMASTDQNQFSSRSHAILQMSLEKKIKKDENNYDIIYSKFLVVDLAGSEKGMEKGKRREEGVNINKSLFTLGNCLNILSEKSNTGKFVPYRDSKLTRILKDSLGGNILTVMLACISPCSNSYEDTLNTLNYAFKAKKITKKVMKNIQEININNLQYKEMIDNLKNEIFQLKQIIRNQEIKLKQKVDVDNNKENIELNTKEYNFENIEENHKINNIDTINNNKLFENEQRTISMTDREKKNEYNILNIDSIDTINIDIYNKYIEDIVNNEINIDNLKNQIELIKKDRNTIETYLLKENKEDNNIIKRYNSIKTLYDKYIEIVNEKLVENIEQNMIYNYNIKEIEELNLANTAKIKELETQNQSGENKQKIIEEISYMKKNIIENNFQKEQIYQNIQKNQEQKEELKKILLNLFENKTNTSDKLIHIIHEKDKLSKITKQYKEEIDNYVKIQKQKDEDMLKINRKIEILRAKLKEKDKKICELEKKGGKIKYENINIKFFNSKKLNQNDNKENSKNKIKRNSVISPAFKDKNKCISSKKISMIHNISEDKNNTTDKGSKNKKRLIIFSNKENKKIKKFQKNVLKFNNDNNNNEIVNKNTKINETDLNKYKELNIPTTTITLSDNNQKEKENINTLYIKVPKVNKWKKTPNNTLKKMKNFTLISMPNKKRNTSINNIEVFPKSKKKHSVKSIKIDLNNNKSDTNSFMKSNSSEKNNSNYIKIDINNLNNKEFKAEKIKIDLTELDKVSPGKNKNDKINDIKYLNTQNDTISRYIKNNSKSNPKTAGNGKFHKYTKKISLQEARFENKLKFQQNNELIKAESFINDYKNNKSKNKKYNEDKKSVYTEPNIESQYDKESKCSFISSNKIYRIKTFNETIESTLENNRKENFY